MNPINFPIGVYYTIICKANQQALKLQLANTANHYKSKIVGQKVNPQDNSQIFMIQKIDPMGYDYEIVSCPKDYVLEENSNQIQLKDGKRSKNQLFNLIPVTSNKYHQYYNIRSGSQNDKALSLQGKLRLSSLDSNSATQQFRFEIANNITIQNSCIIINNASGLVIDVPKASESAGERVIVWDRNNRWNQRWFFQRNGAGYFIKNIMSGMCLDIAQQKRQSGARIVQWNQTGGTNQLWRIEQVGNKLYLIRSCHQSSLCLALRKQDTSSGAYLQVCDTENPTGYWRIDGSLPK